MTFNLLKKHLKKTTPKLLTAFLILSGCASNQVQSTKFDGKWSIEQKHPWDEQKACLSMEDVKKLRVLLLQCEQREK